MGKKLAQYYQYFSNLSLDVVLGVYCCMLLLNAVYHLQLDYHWFLGLPLCAWFTYLLDHFLDLKLNPNLQTQRHNFIKTHQKGILLLLLLILSTLIYIALHPLQLTLVLVGIIIGAMCVVYFMILLFPSLIKKIYFPNKELAVAFIYSSGIFSCLLTSQIPITYWLLHYILFMAITYQSLILNSIVDVETDIKNKQISAVIGFGIQQSHTIFKILSIAIAVGIALTIFIDTIFEPALFLTYLIMLLGNYLLFLKGGKYLQIYTIRVISEIIFWIPLLGYLYAIS